MTVIEIINKIKKSKTRLEVYNILIQSCKDPDITQETHLSVILIQAKKQYRVIDSQNKQKLLN